MSISQPFLGIRHVALPTQDLKRAVDFYCSVLNFTSYAVGDRDWAMVSQAGTFLSLIAVPSAPGAKTEGTKEKHPSHFGWVMPSCEAVDEVHSRLQAQLPQRGLPLPGAKLSHRDSSYGFYFKDPDANQHECI